LEIRNFVLSLWHQIENTIMNLKNTLIKAKQIKTVYYVSMASLFLVFLQPTNVFAQFNAVDGNNCNATNGVEWTAASATVDTDPGSVTSSSNLLKFWVFNR